MRLPGRWSCRSGGEASELHVQGPVLCRQENLFIIYLSCWFGFSPALQAGPGRAQSFQKTLVLKTIFKKIQNKTRWYHNCISAGGHRPDFYSWHQQLYHSRRTKTEGHPQPQQESWWNSFRSIRDPWLQSEWVPKSSYCFPHEESIPCPHSEKSW